MYKINNNKAICTPKYLTKVHIISKKKRERERERERGREIKEKKQDETRIILKGFLYIEIRSRFRLAVTLSHLLYKCSFNYTCSNFDRIYWINYAIVR